MDSITVQQLVHIFSYALVLNLVGQSGRVLGGRLRQASLVFANTSAAGLRQRARYGGKSHSTPVRE